MNRTLPPVEQSTLFVEALEPRIAPAGLLNESKFTSVVAGGTLLLDASDPNGFQGLSTGFGANSGAYLLYITAGKALIYTSDLNGNGILDANEITGIAAGKDAQGRGLDLISFTNINGDIVTNLLPGTGVSSLTDSDNNSLNGRDGRVLLDNGIHSITLRSLTASDIDTSIPGNTVFNRLAPTTYSIFGNIYTGGDFGAAGAGLTIDTTASTSVANKFLYSIGEPSIGSIKTGTAASNQYFHFSSSLGNNDIQGTLQPFTPAVGEHGADIIGVKAANSTIIFDVGTLVTGSGGLGARGGNLAEIVLHGDRGGYKLLAGDGGQGATGAAGGSIINFSDLGTTTSEVILHTGNGGIGLLGAGGAAGTATFANASIGANLQVILGDGGNGFSAGGNGASLPTATFTPPEGPVAVGGTVLGTYHAPGDVGNMRAIGTNAAGQVLFGPRSIDFDGDGFGDAVYTTTNPDQIVILFGDGSGGFTDNTHGLTGFGGVSRTVYLDAPGISAKTITVGDFNGDGKLDIAAASADPTNAGGISVFLNQIGDRVHNPTGGRLITGNPLGDNPFSDPLRTPLPIVNTYFGTNQPVGYGTATPIYAIAAGDFNGDGILDIGVATTLTLNTSPRTVVSNLTVLFGEAVVDPNTGAGVVNSATGKPQASGYFFANYALPGQTAVIDTVLTNPNNNAILKVSALRANSGAPDVLFYGVRNSGNDSRAISELSLIVDPVTHAPAAVPIFTSVALGRVDTNRGNGISLQQITLQDFTLQDIDADGAVDLVALSFQPAGYLGTYKGDGAGGFDGTVSLLNSDQGGVRIVDLVDGTATAIVPTDQNTDGTHDGIFNQVAVLTIRTGTNATPSIVEISLEAAGAPDFYANGTGVPVRSFSLTNTNPDDSVAAFGNYYAQVGIAGSATFPLVDAPETGYGVADPNTSDYRFANIEFFGSGSFIRYLTANGVLVTAGNGGDSTIGKAGAGGTIGSPTNVISNSFGNIQVTIPAYLAYEGQITFLAGSGGNGFGGGGVGGDIQGISVRYTTTNDVVVLTSDVQLSAGNGGDGVSGDGGRGGSISQSSVDTGSFFTAGNGGSGLHGGQGGSILGNQTGTFFDTRSAGVTALAGNGGFGALGGGAGGDISQFNAVYLDVIFGGISLPGGPVLTDSLTGLSLTYKSGNGGSAVAGAGGNGGGILNSSPSTSANFLSGRLSLQTGAGGNGLSGGNGGAITNFVNQSTDPTSIPLQLFVLTGDGGSGVVGSGGNGGTITNFRSNTIGQGTNFARIIAGNGGAGYGTTGGAGGSIISTTSQSSSGPIAVIAGAGGNGLTVGGDGGSVTNATINSAAQTLGKVLVIAGVGGDATAVSRADVILSDNSNPQDLAHAILAFGGASGIGGNGGSISNFVQPVSVQTAVDLIAGNGGSTLNAGSTLSTTTGVGRGGSISNVNIVGTVGASTRDASTGINPPIRSYTDLDNNGIDDITLSAFVQSSLAGSVDINGIFTPANPNSTFQLTNSSGNVGIVAGAAGLVRGGQPARDGINGSVQTVSAGSIMSIIAGSVNRVSPVATLSGITVKNLDGVLGADKSVITSGNPSGGPNNRVEYDAPVIDPATGQVARDPVTGQPIFNIVNTIQPGYRLIDGVIYAQNIAGSQIQGARVFPFTQG